MAALYIAATAIAVGILIYQAYDTADSLNDRELSLRAADLARYVVVDPGLDLPSALAASYQAPATPTFSRYAALGTKYWRPRRRASVKSWPSGRCGQTNRAIFISRTSPADGEYYGLTIEESSAAGPVSVSVARAADADVLVDSLLREFVFDVGWVVPLIVVTLIVGVVAI